MLKIVQLYLSKNLKPNRNDHSLVILIGKNVHLTLHYYYGENDYTSEIRSVQQGDDILTKYNYNGDKLINKRYYKNGTDNGGINFLYNSAG